MIPIIPAWLVAAGSFIAAFSYACRIKQNGEIWEGYAARALLLVLVGLLFVWIELDDPGRPLVALFGRAAYLVLFLDLTLENGVTLFPGAGKKAWSWIIQRWSPLRRQ